MSTSNPPPANTSNRAPSSSKPKLPRSKPVDPKARITPYTGTLLTPGPEAGSWLAALGISLVFVVIVEYLFSIVPVPLGGDTGTWTALSYPFVFYPHPSEIVPFGYPPGLFPLLGFFVLLGGGPLIGPRIYVGVAIVLIGLSTYVLGRSLFRFRISALMVEGLLFVTVPFDRLFFFGGYPTLLALIFTNLALAFGVRYIRGRRPLHLVFFWLAVGATLLTHEFVGLALVVTLAIAGFFLLIKRQLPVSLVASPAGAAGVTIAGAGIGAYYLGTRLKHIPQNNYLSSNALAHLKSSIAPVLYPLHLQALGGVVGYQLIKTPNGAFEIAVGFTALVFFGMLALAIWWPRYLTPSLVIVGASILAIVAMALGGWILNIYTDYRRFAYSLDLPFLLIGMLAFDTVFYWCAAPARRKGARTTPAPKAQPAPARRYQPSPRSIRPRRRELLLVFFALTGVFIVLLAGVVFSYPVLKHYQRQYATPLHTWDYVHAMQAIQNSGIPGSILSVSGGATLHWTFAMSNRNVYSPTVVSGFLFKATRVSDSQLAYFPFHFHSAISNGVQFAGVSSISGPNSTFYSGSPAYGALRYGTPSAILEFAPDSYSVTFANNSNLVVPAWTPADPVPLTTFSSGANPTMTTHYAAHLYNLSYDLNVTSMTDPGQPVVIDVTAVSTCAIGLLTLNAAARPAPGVLVLPKVSIAANTFQWNAGNGEFGVTTTYGTVAAPSTVAYGGGSEYSRGAVTLKFQSPSPAAANGSRGLGLSIALTTPIATSLGTPLPQVISTPSILSNWNTRFVLLDNITRGSEQSVAIYLTQEYRSTIFFRQGQWEVLLLPATLS